MKIDVVTAEQRLPAGTPVGGSDGAGRTTGAARPSRGVFPIVGVGASAGGLDAFTQLLKHLPSDTGMAFILIQHLDPKHPSFLREALSKATEMTVSQTEDGTPVEANHVYVIPPEADISIVGCRIVLSPRPLDGRGQHLPVDFCFNSIAAEGGSRAIGVVLSGNASDGTEGLRAIKAAGGITFTQDPKTAKFPEMPQSAIGAGVVDHWLPIPELARELARLSLHPYVAAPPSSLAAGDEAALTQILAVVRGAVGVDFAEYKSPTFERRLARRMALRRVDSLPGYLSLLEADPKEVRSLYEEVLIHVTSFFRDGEAFEVLASDVLPAVLKDKPPGAPVRFWVAGCSTGEEVYSLAILLLEALRDSSRPVQIFGSDVSEAIIAKARAGVYSDAALRDVSDERRKRYFVKTDRGYRINKTVRDLCVFVQHDLARDPPFAKLDLVSCRNVLIYFQQELQKRIVAAFHYALGQPGFLLLGRTESISGFGQLFSAVDKSNKIFARKAGQSALHFAPRLEARPTERQMVARDVSEPGKRAPDVAKHVDRMLMARYVPPGVVINQKMEVLQFRGQTGTYLEPAQGTPQNNLINMARPGLLSALRAALAQAAEEMAPVRKSGVEVDHDGLTTGCDVVVVPLAGLPDLKEPLFVVLFEETSRPRTRGMVVAADESPGRAASDRVSLRKAEHELAATKEYLGALIEEHNRANDDLGSANEELVSGNEELQSMNEELETAKEELQATNEELTTVNDELQDRNREASQVNSDLVNLLATVVIPVLIVDLERRIRRFTPKARSILNVLPTDVGRPVDDIRPNIDVVDINRRIADVIETTTMKESEVQDREGRWYRMQIRPYKTTDNRIDGAILSLVDIDALKHHVDQAQHARLAAEGANQAKDVFLAVLSHELRTPLSSLLLQAQRLRRAHVGDAARLAQIGDGIERATRTQIQLIDDLLDVSSIVAGKLRIESKAVDLHGVVRAAVEAVTGAVERKSIELEVTMDESVRIVSGDSVRLQQVVWNLLTNAIKFTPERGRVTVTLAAVSGRARLDVTDTGLGIEPAFLPEVFNRFSQQDTSNTRRHGGLGLGLAIVRHLVEQHGGTVHADSLGTGKGATFSVTLPLLHVADTTVVGGPVGVATNSNTAHPADTDGRMKGLRVLLVDDDLGTREAVAGILGEMGAMVMVAESAADAMNAFAVLKPQVLVCDVAMPGEDGYSFIRRLRTLGPVAGGAVPAVALTALATEDDQRRSLAAGFQMHLTKPVDGQRLAAAIVDLVS
jgi:two-component system CheB/CheR fusion protein